MCGILALVTSAGEQQLIKPELQQRLLTELNTLIPRGPDDGRLQVITNSSRAVILGFRRLAIQDTSDVGMQPFFSPYQASSKKVKQLTVAITNGEIYNHQELIKQYCLTMKSGSDCEVIAPLFNAMLAKQCANKALCWSNDDGDNSHLATITAAFEDMLDQLDAEFSLVIKFRHYLLIARDRHGKRGLFFGYNRSCATSTTTTTTAHSYGCASELKALCAEFEHIHPVRPDNFYVINTRFKLEEQQYINCYQTDFYRLIKGIDINNLDTIKQQLRLRLTGAVRKRLQSDRPVGFLLSGGLDSSLIVAIATEILGPDKVVCFSIGLPDSPDVIAAKKVVAHLGLKHHHIVNFTIEDGLAALSEVIRAIESYDITTIRASIPHYLLCKYIRDNFDIKVIMSGEGSDELHGSYRYFADAPTTAAFRAECLRLLRELYLFDNLRSDRCIAANGLEGRFPFLDNGYVNYVLSLPAHLWQFAGGYSSSSSSSSCTSTTTTIGDSSKSSKYPMMEKLLLRQAFAGALPDDVLFRPKEAFSDAVSDEKTNWYRSMQQHADKIISDQQLAEANIRYKSGRLPTPVPQTKEAYLYRRIFDLHYYGHANVCSHYWLPRFQTTAIIDPSATVLKSY